ncbi:sensor histidine kinase [Nocardioides aquiterrae]|uniref:histidine kinase n=1 Tax=Nocardioides aquiterrae TaxID=203799 RepID=A0ABN1UR56_9ACTN
MRMLLAGAGQRRPGDVRRRASPWGTPEVQGSRPALKGPGPDADGIYMPAAPLSLRRRWPSWLPRGGSLPDPAWRARHRAVMALLWCHIALIPLYAVYKGNSLLHGYLEVAPVLMCALLAGFGRLSRNLESSIAAAGLMICSGVIVHLSGGMIEAHFHFFVMIPVIALYEAWAPFLLAVAYVLFHHGIMGTISPKSVFNLPAAWEHPWLFAGVHAGFFAFACIACIINWWLHENARLATQAQTQLLSTIVDSIRDGLVVLDSEGRTLLRNPAGVALMGGLEYESHSVGAPDGKGLFHLDGRPLSHDELLHVQALAEGRHDVDLAVRAAGVPDGRVLNFSATALPAERLDGAPDVVVVFRDVTERHRTEQALAEALATEQAAVEQLRELERVKSDFVSTVSHELRTPITSIIGYLEVLVDGSVGRLEDAQRRIVDRVDRNSRRLLRLVEDLLKLSQIESSTLSVDTVPTDLRDVVSAAQDAVGWLLDTRSLDVSIDVPEEPVELDGDADELERIVVNLVTNAIKFTPDGGRIAVRLSGDDLEAVLVVSDTGLGVPEAEVGQLFTRFYRSSIASEEAVQGTGLGLTIVQATVAAHGGTIDVESTAGLGTTFTVRLPRRPASRSVA